MNYVAVAAVLPVWLFASRFMEKRTGFNLSLVAGELLPAVTLVAAPSLPASWVKPAFIFYSVIGALSARVTFEDAMLADCVEYDQLYSGKRREGQYQGAENTLLDFASVFQNAVGFAVLAAAGTRGCGCGCGYACGCGCGCGCGRYTWCLMLWLANDTKLTCLRPMHHRGSGYKEGAQVQPASVVTSARIVAAVPIVVMFVLQALMMGYRLSKRRHASVVHALQTHQQGRPAVDPLTNAMVPPPDEVRPHTHGHTHTRALLPACRAVNDAATAILPHAWCGCVTLCVRLCVCDCVCLCVTVLVAVCVCDCVCGRVYVPV